MSKSGPVQVFCPPARGNPDRTREVRNPGWIAADAERVSGSISSLSYVSPGHFITSEVWLLAGCLQEATG